MLVSDQGVAFDREGTPDEQKRPYHHRLVSSLLGTFGLSGQILAIFWVTFSHLKGPFGNFLANL